VTTWKAQVERARMKRHEQRWDELSYRLWRLGITSVARTHVRTASVDVLGEQPTRLKREYQTTITVR
jgi:hypothetical protein